MRSDLWGASMPARRKIRNLNRQTQSLLAQTAVMIAFITMPACIGASTDETDASKLGADQAATPVPTSTPVVPTSTAQTETSGPPAPLGTTSRWKQKADEARTTQAEGDLSKAERLWQDSVAAADKLGDPSAQVQALTGLTDLYYRMGKGRLAIDYYRRLVEADEKRVGQFIAGLENL